MVTETQPVVECRQISKLFPGVQALKNVDFSIYKGRVHGLVGANGAGKSTLFKILAGVHRQDSGEILFEGTPYGISDTQDAITKGVVTVHQDINLIDTLTVTENILLNNEQKRFGLLDSAGMRRYVEELLSEHGIDVDPDSPVSELPNDQKKLVQIMRAISLDAKVLLLDEPTSSLTEEGIRIVHTLIHDLAARSVGVVFISHYLSEVFEVSDEITVLRDGLLVGTNITGKTSLKQVVIDMIGKDLVEKEKSYSDAAGGNVVLRVRGLTVSGKLDDISFDLRAGEILGATGIIGSGLSDLARSLFGFENRASRRGEVGTGDGDVAIETPFDAVSNGIALLTNDRLREGILPSFPLYENICLPILSRFRNRFGLLNRDRMVATGEEAISRLSIKAGDSQMPISQLSGGNQQKVLFAKWLGTNPRVFILDEPTIGIDVGSKDEIRKIIREVAAQGVGILLLTTEQEELELMCDRVLVLFRGRIVQEFAGKEINKDAITHAAIGGDNEN